jgi:diadenosine tetraphosphatase ApaH/serine/threonine PP2A family protein phosphatase
MLIALLSDIHGNREALDASLAHAARMRAERYVFLGDYVGYGADPASVVDTVRRYVTDGAVALRGNHDAAVDGSDQDMNGMARAAIAWTRGRLDGEQRAWLAGLPLVHEEGERLYVHASACDPGDWEYVTGPVQAERSLRRTSARVVFCGHVHVPALYHMAPDKPAIRFDPVPGQGVPLLPTRRWLGVMGAVGQPRDGDPAAAYALLNHEHGTLTLMRVPYDVDAAAAKILAAGLPGPLAARLRAGR